MSNENENRETEFDPTESDAFYENLEAALEMDETEKEAAEEISEEPAQEEELPVADAPVEEVPEQESETEEELPELVFAADLFDATDEELADMASAQDTLAGEEQPEDAVGELDVDDELFFGVDAALTEQIENEFGNTATTKEGIGSKIAGVLKKIPVWTKVLITVILVILLSVVFLFGTKPGRELFSNVAAKIIFGQINVVPDDIPTPTPSETPGLTPELTPTPVPTEGAAPTEGPSPTEGAEPTEEPTLTPTSTPIPTPTVNPVMDDPNIINVLLIGEENIYGASRGRTDTIMIGSVNKKTGELKLVSLLRDTYVRLPNGEGAKLNAAYAKGGATMMIETIESNFKVDIDGYVIINFEGFENLIDELGGLRISLTPEESDYLNTTRYISNPEERNTVAGYQMMTGSQVLGYCRVRYVATANGLKDDFGRTYRQRTVLKALFDKYKEKNFVELMSVMSKCFKYVTAPKSLEKTAADCLQVVIEHKTLEFDQQQIPARGKYTNEIISGMDVLYPKPENIEILQKFLYGEDAD